MGDESAGAVRVYVDMVGDLFHAAHVALLREARSHGDRLVVGVLSDETAASYKRRPIMTLAERVAAHRNGASDDHNSRPTARLTLLLDAARDFWSSDAPGPARSHLGRAASQ